MLDEVRLPQQRVDAVRVHRVCGTRRCGEEEKGLGHGLARLGRRLDEGRGAPSTLLTRPLRRLRRVGRRRRVELFRGRRRLLLCGRGRGRGPGLEAAAGQQLSQLGGEAVELRVRVELRLRPGRGGAAIGHRQPQHQSHH
eukprot:scaffold84891_cov66-Phaeocystis_antarctica.AAC.3